MTRGQCVFAAVALFVVYVMASVSYGPKRASMTSLDCDVMGWSPLGGCR
jgi:hypothetical protein